VGSRRFCGTGWLGKAALAPMGRGRRYVRPEHLVFCFLHDWLLAASDEQSELLFRAEATQRLQSRGRIRGGRVALDSGGVDFLSGFRRAALGDEDIYRRRHPWVSGGADFLVGV